MCSVYYECKRVLQGRIEVRVVVVCKQPSGVKYGGPFKCFTKCFNGPTQSADVKLCAI